MDTFTVSRLLIQICVLAARLRKQWNISYFAAPSGINKERKCYDIRPQELEASHSFWEERQCPILHNGNLVYQQYEQPFNTP
jgi:hypothetical protein